VLEADRSSLIAKRLQPFFGEEIEALYSAPPCKASGVLMGTAVWGKEYIERFGLYCLASIGAPANMAALKGRCRMVLYCEQAAKPVLFRITRWLARAEIDVQLMTIPPWVMELTQDFEQRFFVLGCIQNVLAHQAGRSGMGFHMLMPDHVYGQGYFANMFRLAEQHQAIAQAGVSTRIATAADVLEQYRDAASGALVVPDQALGDIAVQHMHPESRMHLMNDASIPDRMPKSHRLIWQAKDHVRIHSCHVNAAWLAPHLVRDAPIAFTSTMDCLLPEYVPNAEFVTPDLLDGMGYIEISSDKKPVLSSMVGPDEMAEWVWNQISFTADFTPYFAAPMELPTSRDDAGMEIAEIDRQYKQVMALLDERKAGLMQAFLQRRFGNRFQQDAMLPEAVR
jgi:hypothetical protein